MVQFLVSAVQGKLKASCNGSVSSVCSSRLTVDIIQGDTKKRELLKNPTKIEEIQENKIIYRN